MEIRTSATRYADPDGWATEGACRKSDPELFFPVTSRGPALRQLARAKAICECCAVRPQCLEFALETGQNFGIWGGTSEDERQTMRRRRLQYRPVTARRG